MALSVLYCPPPRDVARAASKPHGFHTCALGIDPSRWLVYCAPASSATRLTIENKEITMRNPLLLASRAAGACFLALAILSPAQAAPVLQMSAANTATGFDLTVRAQDVVDLYAYQFTLNFSPALLTALGGMEGSFLATGGTTFFDQGSIDNTAGSISYVFSTLIGPLSGVTGSGDLATFSFDIAQAGIGSFSLSDVMVLDSTFADIPVSSADLTVQVGQVPEPGSLWLAAVALLAVLGGRMFKQRTR